MRNTGYFVHCRNFVILQIVRYFFFILLLLCLLPHLILLLLCTSTSILRHYCSYLYYSFYHNYATLPLCLKFGRTSTKFIVYANVIIQNTCLGASKCIPNGLVCCNCSFISIAICALCLYKGDLFLQLIGKHHIIIKSDKWYGLDLCIWNDKCISLHKKVNGLSFLLI